MRRKIIFTKNKREFHILMFEASWNNSMGLLLAMRDFSGEENFASICLPASLFSASLKIIIIWIIILENR